MTGGMMAYIRDWEPQPEVQIPAWIKGSEQFFDSIRMLVRSGRMYPEGFMYDPVTNTLHHYDFSTGVVPDYVRERIEEMAKGTKS